MIGKPGEAEPPAIARDAALIPGKDWSEFLDSPCRARIMGPWPCRMIVISIPQRS
jgi:hypothetical protein